MLKPGTYKLSRDVANPTPDRRKKRDWRSSPSWTEGTELLVQVANDRATEDCYTLITLVGERRTYMAIGPGHLDQFIALESALVQCEESDDAMLTALGVSDNFAQWLAKSGKIDRDVFRALWAEYQDIDDEEADRIDFLSVGGSGRFRVQIFDAGTPTISSSTDDYLVALRRASDELLGSGGDYAEIFLGKDKVALAYLQRKNRKSSVKIVEEKPRRR
jgi:hypothetical protein